ncbi:MAG: hypothetical protein MJ220_04275 [Bacilli bacterium]|nr:hypothetical protein [Bacilli bacterium]
MLKVTGKRLLIFSGINFGLALIMTVLTYILFHYYTDEGFTSIRQSEPAKPFMSDMFGILTVLFLFASIASLIAYFVFREYKKKQ